MSIFQQSSDALFQTGEFILHSGQKVSWKIECDALTPEDWAGLAAIAIERLPAFGLVVGVPTGGVPFADALRPYVTSGPTLIADDVLTTGGSMKDHRLSFLDVETIGVVAFNRTGVELPWVTSLFTLSAEKNS